MHIAHWLDGEESFSAAYSIELDGRTINQALPVDQRHRALLHHSGQPVVLAAVQNGICMSPFGFLMFMGLSIALIAAVIVTISFKLRPKHKIKELSKQ
uniref:Uncharacterized protein n=1 Tax=Onchocerca volvulus TaxID=6282 RepID=A0A8R1XPW7_ONCVO